MGEKPIAAFDWQGHRGARGLMPENTISSFIKALEFPVSTLELDVVVCKDSLLIISHEPWMSHHICNKPDGSPVTKEEEQGLAILKMTYDEIKQYDCGSRGHDEFPGQQKTAVHKPSLREMVMAVDGHCKTNNLALPRYNIEIKRKPEWDGTKTPDPEFFCRLLLDEIASLGIKERTCIQSFDKQSLQIVHRMDSTIVTALLIENMNGVAKNLEELGYVPQVYSPHYMMVTANVVNRVHEEGMRIIPWTVNDLALMQRMISLGVDGIITDYPDKILEVK